MTSELNPIVNSQHTMNKHSKVRHTLSIAVGCLLQLRSGSSVPCPRALQMWICGYGGGIEPAALWFQAQSLNQWLPLRLDPPQNL